MEKPAALCFTCFQHPGLQFISVQTGENCTASDLLRKHFWFTYTDFQQAIICLSCWDQVKSFNRFYVSVEQLYNNRVATVVIKAEPERDQVQEFSKSELIIKDEPLETSSSAVQHESNYGVEQQVDRAEEEDSDFVQSSDDDDEEEDDGHRGYSRKQNKKSLEERQIEDDIIRQHVRFMCKKCDLELTTFDIFRRHCMAHDNKAPYVLCCGKHYYHKKRLIDHVQVLSNPDMFRCEHCQKNFDYSQGLRRHLEECHAPEEERNFKCDRCPKSYVNQYKFKVHMRNHLEWENQTCKCEHCGMLFKTRDNLKSHMNRKHTESSLFVCSICSKGFRSKAWFEQHQLKHVNGSDLMVECKICLKWFKNRGSWRTHMQDRHEETVPPCELCGHVARNRRCLKRHILRHHPDGVEHQPSGEDFEQSGTVQTDVQPKTEVKCDICCHTSPNLRALKRHKSRMHGSSTRNSANSSTVESESIMQTSECKLVDIKQEAASSSMDQ